MTEEQKATGEKNLAKMNSYALAFAKIDEAILHNYPLEAVAIEESILSDRIWSSLHAAKLPQQKHETLGAALDALKRHEREEKFAAVVGANMISLKKDLTSWWDRRNKVIHGIVKSSQGKGPAITANNFERSAMKAARIGKILARKVDGLTKKQIHKANSKNNED